MKLKQQTERYISRAAIKGEENIMAFSPETYALLAGQSGGGSGGGDSIFLVHNVDGTLDKTWQEIYNAAKSGKLPVVQSILETSPDDMFVLVSPATYVDCREGEYTVRDESNTFAFITNSPDGYPVAD